MVPTSDSQIVIDWKSEAMLKNLHLEDSFVSLGQQASSLCFVNSQF